MNKEAATPDLIGELKAVQRAKTADLPSFDDVDAWVRAIALLYNSERKLWTPDALKGLLLLEIDADEWESINRSASNALSKLAKDTVFRKGDVSFEGFILGMIRADGLEKASQNKTVSNALETFLKDGNAAFFEKVAGLIRELRDGRPEDSDWAMPDGSMRDQATWTLVIGWNRTLFPHLDLPPFAFWTYDAITDFCESLFKIDYGREGIRRRISELGLKMASVVFVRSLEHTRDGSGFRPLFKKRRRPVKGQKGDKKSPKVSE